MLTVACATEPGFEPGLIQNLSTSLPEASRPEGVKLMEPDNLFCLVCVSLSLLPARAGT